MAATIRPSKDKSGGIQILGYGGQFQDATFNNNSVKDQYLTAAMQYIATCREWQRFEASDEEYEGAIMVMANTSTRAMDAQSQDVTLAGWKSAMDEARRTNAETMSQLVQQIRTDIASRPALLLSNASTESRLKAIEDWMKANPPYAGPDLPSSTTWTVRFSLAGRDPNASDLASARSSLTSTLAKCKAPVVNVVGFADLSGSEAANLRLSKQRAEAVHSALEVQYGAQYLVSGGGEVSRFGTDPSSNRIAVVSVACIR
ncbi:OmpA family protein [Sphingobium sp. HWE2-09]|uniref:OmpA family protein n=1 Tax=Sphingobium sp. HWE2-09 TaxID=3108390 RepID=UPI002DD0A845|nr:OmpA family protein [Sphingobium sp. HWE2-09]